MDRWDAWSNSSASAHHHPLVASNDPIMLPNTQLIYPLAFSRVPPQAGLVEDAFIALWGIKTWGTVSRRSNIEPHLLPTACSLQHLTPGHCIAMSLASSTSTHTHTRRALEHRATEPAHYGPPSMHRPGLSDEAGVGEPAQGEGDLCRDVSLKPNRQCTGKAITASPSLRASLTSPYARGAAHVVLAHVGPSGDVRRWLSPAGALAHPSRRRAPVLGFSADRGGLCPATDRLSRAL